MTKPKSADLPKLAAPAQRALAGAGLHTLKQLTQVSEAELLQLHGLGKNALATLRHALAQRGWGFRVVASPPGNAMNKIIRAHLDHIFADDAQAQMQAYFYLMKKTEQPVDWAYAAWDELVAGLTHPDNHTRAIAAQVLANLAKSDPKGRMLTDFEALLRVTYDERFVTARHCLQNLWKVGLGGRKQQDLVMEGFTRRFADCAAAKQVAVIRADIIHGLKQLYTATTREQIKITALALMEAETDLKRRKKYLAVWRK
jgi:hypothetical protein